MDFPTDLTPDMIDIDSMPAGREIDALVAEKVMGFDLYKQAGFNSWGRHYSTEIAAAWEVVEKFYAEGWDFDLDQEHDEPVCAGFYHHRDSYGQKDQVWVGAVTAPLAICRAALKVVNATQPCQPSQPQPVAWIKYLQRIRYLSHA